MRHHAGHGSWQHKILQVLHKPAVQGILAGLLLLDVLILCTELVLLTLFPSCHLVERDAISCCPVLTEHRGLDAQINFEDHHAYCPQGYHHQEEDDTSSWYPAACDEHKWSTVHATETALLIATLVILTIFFVELHVTLVALTPRIFFCQLWYTLDYVIVTTSLILEITFLALDKDTLTSIAGLIILGRLWRFVRIGHGILEFAHEIAQDKIDELQGRIEELRKEHPATDSSGIAG